ncbi:MAG: iron complex outermembrane receptor protein [Flavobacteriales bacterium]|jgi:iron complex outermembrane receptor protein
MFKNRFNKSRLSIAIACVVGSSFGQAVMAQDDAVERAVEEVIVTAERREASLQSTAIAVSALTQESLIENDISDVTGLSGFVPNLVVSGQEEQSDVKIYIRGVGTNNPTEVGDQGVGVYVDGVFAVRAQGALALMYDLDSVQVLRGPQGTLFGRNNTGGAVLLQTKKPGSEFEGDFQLSYGSFNRQQVSGGVTLPISDNLSFRVASYSDSDDGWVKAIATDPRGDGDVTGFSGSSTNRIASPTMKLNNTDVASTRVTGVWGINDRLNWTASFETFADKGNGGILLNPVLVEDGIYEAFIDSPVSLDLQSDVFRSTLSYDITDGLNIEYIVGLSDLFRSQVVDQDAGITSRFQEGRTEYQKSSGQSHELKFQNTDGERIDWTAGYYYFEEDTDIRFDFDGREAWLDGGMSFNQPARGSVSEALYAQATYHLSDHLSATGGVRYTDDLKYDRGGRNITECNGDFINPTLGGSDLSVFEDFLNNRTGAEGADGLDDLDGTEARRDQCVATLRNDIESEDDQITYLARLSYEWDESLLYASLGTGYRAGVIQDGGESTDPENSKSYEVGYKIDRGPVRFNAAAFFMEYTDLIRSGFSDVTNRIENSNVAGAEISGLEFELIWLVGSAGTFDLSGGYLDAKYTEYKVAGTSFGTNLSIGSDGLVSLEGNTLPQSPEFSFNSNFRWDFDLSNGAVLTPRVNLRYVDEVYFRDENENGAPINNVIYTVEQTGYYSGNPAGQEAYTKVNFGLNYNSGDNWDVDLFINNVTDEMVKSSAAVDNNTASGFPGRYAPPRTYGVRLKTSF